MSSSYTYNDVTMMLNNPTSIDGDKLEEQSSKKENGNQNLYDAQIEGKLIDHSTLKRSKFDKTFTVFTTGLVDQGDIPYNAISAIINSGENLYNSGFVYRFNGDLTHSVRDQLSSKVYAKYLELDADRIETYLPFKKFSDSKFAETAKIKSPTLEARQITVSYNPKYNDVKPGLKSFMSRQTHMVLGANVDKPLSLIMVYNKSGIETLKDNNNVGKIGNLWVVLRMADDLGIPVFNFGNQDAENRLNEYLNTIRNGG